MNLVIVVILSKIVCKELDFDVFFVWQQKSIFIIYLERRRDVTELAASNVDRSTGKPESLPQTAAFYSAPFGHTLHSYWIFLTAAAYIKLKYGLNFKVYIWYIVFSLAERLSRQFELGRAELQTSRGQRVNLCLWLRRCAKHQHQQGPQSSTYITYAAFGFSRLLNHHLLQSMNCFGSVTKNVLLWFDDFPCIYSVSAIAWPCFFPKVIRFWSTVRDFHTGGCGLHLLSNFCPILISFNLKDTRLQTPTSCGTHHGKSCIIIFKGYMEITVISFSRT